MEKREASTDIESLHRGVKGLAVTCSILGISIIILTLGCIRLALTVRGLVKSIDLITVWQGEVIAGLQEENDVLEEVNTLLQQIISLLG